MKPALVAIFAHPDDEAFGPAGTIAKYSKSHDIYIICATCGEAGENYIQNPKESIKQIRKKELHASAKILGVKNTYMLGFKDGALCNNDYHTIANQIKLILDKIKPEILLTFELRGVSGHLDHVAIAMITYFLFYKVPYAKKMMSYVIMREVTNELRDYFIYVPHGFKRERVDEIVDISNFLEIKKQAIMQHKSQKLDVDRALASIDRFPKEEYFLVHKKPNS